MTDEQGEEKGNCCSSRAPSRRMIYASRQRDGSQMMTDAADDGMTDAGHLPSAGQLYPPREITPSRTYATSTRLYP